MLRTNLLQNSVESNVSGSKKKNNILCSSFSWCSSSWCCWSSLLPAWCSFMRRRWDWPADDRVINGSLWGLTITHLSVQIADLVKKDLKDGLEAVRTSGNSTKKSDWDVVQEGVSRIRQPSTFLLRSSCWPTFLCNHETVPMLRSQ